MGSRISKENFVVRNRCMALISDASAIVEAEDDNGTPCRGGRHPDWEDHCMSVIAWKKQVARGWQR